jgi:hypothetical protein
MTFLCVRDVRSVDAESPHILRGFVVLDDSVFLKGDCDEEKVVVIGVVRLLRVGGL